MTSRTTAPPCQRVIANLGRADQLAASGALASLIASGAKLTDQVLLIDALDDRRRAVGRGQARLSFVHIGDPSANQVASLESQPIPATYHVPGQAQRLQ